MIVSGPGLSPPGGQFPGVLPGYQAIVDEEYRIVRGPADAALAVQENVSQGAQVIKIYSNNTPNPGALSPAELDAIVATAKLLGVRVAAHATDDAAVWRAVSAGVNSIEHGYEVSDSTLRLMAQKGVYLVPTDVDTLTAVAYAKAAGMDGPLPQGLVDYMQLGARAADARRKGGRADRGRFGHVHRAWHGRRAPPPSGSSSPTSRRASRRRRCSRPRRSTTRACWDSRMSSGVIKPQGIRRHHCRKRQPAR